MKLFKKIISVLLSTSYMFTSIVFADGPEETPKTGTKKLEKVYLANVAQYMSMTEKIKLEQVSKSGAESLKIGYADNFLFCYGLLKDSTDEIPEITEFNHYKKINQAFSSSGKLLILTQNITKLPDFQQKFSDFACLVKPVNFFYAQNLIKKHVVFLPRIYKGKGKYENKLPELQKFEKWLFDKNYVLPDEKDICTDKSILSMQSYFKLNKYSIIASCPCGSRKDLANLYYEPLEEQDFYETGTDIQYKSNKSAVYLNISWETAEEYAHVMKKYVYRQLNAMIRNDHCSLKDIASKEQRYSELIEDLKKETDEDWYNNTLLIQKIKKFILDLGTSTTEFLVLKDPKKFDNEEFLVPTHLVFCDFLPQDISCLKNFFLNIYRNYDFFCVPWTDYNEFKSAFVKLDYYKNPANTIISTKPLIYLPKFNKEELLSNFLYQLKTERSICTARACVCIEPDFSPCSLGLPQHQYHLFSEDKLKSTIYLLSKAKCSLEQFEQIGEKILESISFGQPCRTRALAKSILDDAKNLRGEFEDLEPWSTSPAPASNISPISTTKTHTQQSEDTQNSNFGTALVGVTGLSALGALVYNGINKYKNKPSNISKSKNNKNINKKIAKNIS